MFLGTNNRFKVLYFLTSMFPAYLIVFFDILLNYIRGKWGSNLLALLVILFFLIFILLGLQLKRIIENTESTSQSTVVKSELITLEEINGDVVSYLLGVILPSVIIISESSLLINGLIFVLIQLSIYILMVRSTSLLPNIFMILFFRMTIFIGAFSNNTTYFITFTKNPATFRKNSKFKIFLFGDDSNTFFIKGDINNAN